MSTEKVRPLFPPYVDSTLLAAFRSCPQKAFRSYVEHWKPKSESVHLVAGKAYAEGLEKARRAFYEQGLSAEDSEAIGAQALLEAYGDFECPSDSAKSPERMLGALEFYFQRYPLGTDAATPITFGEGKRGIEFSFAEPLDIEHPTLGQPLMYTGRSDMVVDFAGGIYIEDDKTTSQLGASWPRQWELRSQFTGYTWAGKRAGFAISGVLVRGVSILKSKYDTMEVVTNRSQWEIARWYDQTMRDIKRMIQCWEDGHWDYNLDHACSEYGGCQLQNICKRPSPEIWLNQDFEKRVWDPLARRELSPEEWEAEWTGGQIPVIRV